MPLVARIVLVSTVILAWGSSAPAQELPSRTVTLMFGVGQAMPWVGANVAYHASNRVSILGGVGYVPGPVSGSTMGLAAGARYYVQEGNGRPFFEVSISPIASEQIQTAFLTSEPEALYGVSPQMGYEYMWGNRITLLASGGAGFTLESDFHGENHIEPAFNLGLGYTFGKE